MKASHKLLPITIFFIFLVCIPSIGLCNPDTWSSGLLGTFDDETNDNFYSSYAPNFAGTLNQYCLKIDVTTSNALDAGDGIEFYHSNDGTTDSVYIGNIDQPSVGVYWINSTDTTLLSEIEHDGTTEYLHSIETGTIVGLESLVADLYLYLEYTPTIVYEKTINQTISVKTEPQTQLILVAILKLDISVKPSIKIVIKSFQTLLQDIIPEVKPIIPAQIIEIIIEQAIKIFSQIETLFRAIIEILQQILIKPLINILTEIFITISQIINIITGLPPEEAPTPPSPRGARYLPATLLNMIVVGAFIGFLVLYLCWRVYENA